MNEIIIKTCCSKSRILVGESIRNLKSYLPDKKLVIISDINLKTLYGDLFPEGHLILIPVGEKNKTIETVTKVYEEFLNAGIDRNCFVLGIGGGVVCDIAGFVASTFMRGMDFGFVSTSLLSQVDASVGGKNGVNFRDFKNQIGTINQPDFVICDTEMLRTLPESELRCGFAEIIKHGLIEGGEYFRFIKENSHKAFSLDSKTMNKLVLDSIRLKSKIVESDEQESGERRKLNFGHSFGHAIEINTGLSHGESVSIGMNIAAKISELLNFSSNETSQEIEEILKTYNLPLSTNCNADKLFKALQNDKKKQSEQIHYVFIRDIGQVFAQPIGFNELREHYLNISKSE